ncbi:P-type conjugative transfer protein TrbJ [Alcaligenes ammonioxydans]|uniref:P-type conjugative transfer protein TrbJ n=1 Tax=Alcaligenes ammonioxydans TaxID=2582914 RepID=UPI001F05E764|nr:P-type conjugative transfer protein TrbJ [Alcaligenes ammonioxydans]MCH1879083.1 P-type conjugative transfer protein TrbJ [Alcaligenes ammonioxydans]
MRSKTLAAKKYLVIVLTTTACSMSAHAGIPVIDAGNLKQNVLTAMESVAQTLKQVEQYQTQLQQYENMLQNTAAPAAYIWDQAQSTINSLMDAVDTLNYYRNQAGSLDKYLAKFQDAAYYRGSPCFSASGCTDADWASMNASRGMGSESQKRANDALLLGLSQQQTALKNDARTLGRLQSQAQNATGQMQAISYANQFASQQANQLLQIRGLLIAQQNAAGAKLQAEADLDAKQQAAHAAATESRIETTSSPKNWLNLTR